MPLLKWKKKAHYAIRQRGVTQRRRRTMMFAFRGRGIPLRARFLMMAQRVENVAVGDVKTLINKGSYSTSRTLRAAIMSK